MHRPIDRYQLSNSAFILCTSYERHMETVVMRFRNMFWNRGCNVNSAAQFKVRLASSIPPELNTNQQRHAACRWQATISRTGTNYVMYIAVYFVMYVLNIWTPLALSSSQPRALKCRLQIRRVHHASGLIHTHTPLSLRWNAAAVFTEPASVWLETKLVLLQKTKRFPPTSPFG
jgi:hypothetical protein